MARKRAKQKTIPGTEEEFIREVEDAADNYVSCRDERMGLTVKEVEAKEKLIEVMHKYDLSVYKTSDGKVVTVAHKETDDVKVQEPKAKGQDGESDFGGE